MPTQRQLTYLSPELIEEMNANRDADNLSLKDPMIILMAYEDGKKLGVIEWFESFDEWLSRISTR